MTYNDRSAGGAAGVAAASATGTAAASNDFAFLGPKWGDATTGSTGGTVSWSMFYDVAYLSSTQRAYLAHVRAAFDAWEYYADIDFVEVDSSAADITLDLTRIDGVGGSLGQAMWSSSARSGAFDRMDEAFIEFDNADYPGASIDFFATALHEIGHAIGLDHTDAITEVMYPYYNGVSELASGDVTGAQTIYGAASGAAILRLGTGSADTLDLSFAYIPYVVMLKGGNDRFFGGDQNDTIKSGHGNDSTDGGGGNDFIRDNGGNDQHHGGAGNDRIVDLVGSNLLDGGAGRDKLLGGSGEDTIEGGDGNDKLFGDGGASSGGAGDFIFGDAGNDTIEGGVGDDWLMGGSDADVFVFAPDQGRDTITRFVLSGSNPGYVGTDFVTGQDRIDLTAFGYASAAAALAEFGDNGQGHAVFRDDGTTIVLRGISTDELSAGDLIV